MGETEKETAARNLLVPKSHELQEVAPRRPSQPTRATAPPNSTVQTYYRTIRTWTLCGIPQKIQTQRLPAMQMQQAKNIKALYRMQDSKALPARTARQLY
jgi:hypothetical protein